MPHALALDAGAPAPLGSRWDGGGVNFAVYSRHAARVELCLFDASGRQERARLTLPARTGDVWHGYLPGAAPGTVYGYRVHGCYAPHRGERFNPHKLLLDPCACALTGDFVWHDAVYGYRRDRGADDPNARDPRDSAPYVPKSRVVAPAVRGARPPKPGTPWRDTVIYELHVRGFTRRHPDVPAPLRGTVAGLGTRAAIAHLRELGVSAIELLPTAAFIDETELARRGRRNYWGYNPLAPCAPHPRYLAHDGDDEFAGTVDRLHEAGIEVIVDVVLNHTAERDARGPTLCLRGLDNASYYRLDPERPARYVDYTGCGNTLDLSRPAAIALALATLRHWACDIGVDGFRFDLATTMLRDADGRVGNEAPLVAAILADAELASLKLIAEPWDATLSGYRLGGFAPPFAEWNDRYRDGMRRFWRGDRGAAGECATRFAGSSDVFARAGRAPSASVNFVTAHDGFTLADLTSYAAPRGGGPGASSGRRDEITVCGADESAADDASVRLRRRRLRASMLGALAMSHGTPMIVAGDEFSRTLHGDNNAYCVDSPASWIDWSARGDPDRDLRTFVTRALSVRRTLDMLRQTRFFDGRPIAAQGADKDIAWLLPEGRELTEDDWRANETRGFAALLADPRRGGDAPPPRIYVAMNARDTRCAFRLPESAGERTPDWLVALDSDAIECAAAGALYPGGSWITVEGGGFVALVPADTAGVGVAGPLAARARRAGIAIDYVGADGLRRQVPAEALERLVAALGERADAAEGPDGTTRAGADAARPSSARRPATQAPARCWLPLALRQRPGCWALSVQTYGLRSARSWGIGDFDDLAHMIDVAARLGAAGVQSSPVHALSLSQPQRASPYAPCDRLMLNPLLISAPLAAGDAPPPDYLRFVEQPRVRAELSRIERAATIDYPAVASLKRQALALLHAAFVRDGPDAERTAYRAFCHGEGVALREYATFEALGEWQAAQQGRYVGWMQWPSAYRDPRSTPVADFADAHRERIDFFMYLQWQARRQWHRAAARGRDARMALGLVADLALGAGADSVEAWRWPGLAALDAELGAPPDAFAARGQRWGLAPWRVQRLADADFAPFAAVLDAAMRDAGALRIDHAAGLMRQFWVPRGGDAARGAYVSYPFDALLARITRASAAHRCAVIGEDLGNVPPGLRERLTQAHILGCRVVYFERTPDHAFVAGDRYPPLTAAMASTHDLPTIAGFYSGADNDELDARGLRASPSLAALAREERRVALATLRARLAPYGDTTNAAAFARALHRFLADCASRLVIVQLDDALGVERQANLPPLGDAPPNWRQRIPVAIDALANHGGLRDLAWIFEKRAPSNGSSRTE
ncbi:glycogen debranching protein GlgX [Burkholderia thailandensis]|uniref:glycogen debranching protein GlgX n=2 Tax=Burkholderia thailandensis TaxID=57975 RepID=UPI0003EC7BC1|nr:glycogen debranching protein GlgX [Burkholderia thailandensis]AHI68320.1 glycogen debranching enzyme GlgX [Burkholderia thailandensis H0587]AIP66076.1 glycogen operon protein GlgX [Burkholderia thailandensis]AOI55027.1 4-alpha-glucanotransferase [Burkholderia thailandensis]AOJ53544.1 4-alpha-glucanotransferase [Burkholderia thailandensis]AVR28323.1 4-alpha-glucanotransferase [Burkholderia thailandensis]